ncbi:MAG: envelope stress response membrane protein PspB [Alphaproteobacteria bacterium]|nr:envelope stress response membrane protein PspB [Alphaproteobacteria bacterium]
MPPEIIIAPLVVGILFLGLPWLILHYMTKWKTAATLTREDENLLDELYDIARRLEDRMTTIERIIAADDPNWKKSA